MSMHASKHVYGARVQRNHAESMSNLDRKLDRELARKRRQARKAKRARQEGR